MLKGTERSDEVDFYQETKTDERLADWVFIVVPHCEYVPIVSNRGVVYR